MMVAVLELKIKLIKDILDDRTDETILDSLEKLYQRLTSGSPCTYSLEELEQRLNEAEEDFEKGRGIQHGDIKRK
ncbi:MAG: hypothetical protein U2P89_12015 [Proteiniphilum sp.]|uniref:hypothetical protein n=1 Tax=Proteiniphilum sp. TaxID=1926877 RepID=UPI0008F3A540|nr:hypothetical protein [Proteiniphilum sp.]MDY9919579.1 hypothetical protein [Proteiniphilum sp.]SFK43761.1 hypothetical protein SAMN05216357_102153 [Porphyromonadaceae bacterium KH3CP3RA]